MKTNVLLLLLTLCFSSFLCQEAEPFTTSLVFDYAVHMIPHNDKKDRGGEDAYFASPNLIVVADGVGGWAKKGVDPGFFSRRLAALLGEKHAADPHQDMKKALLSSCVEASNEHLGSSTAVLMKMDEGGVVETVNLGDCGYIIYRFDTSQVNEEGQPVVKFVKVFRSKEQQYSFNFPYQCGSGHPDAAEQAEVNSHTLLEGDIIMMASDGLLDNLFEKQIQKCISIFVRTDFTIGLKKAANCLATNAIDISLQQDITTPFSMNAKKAGKYHKGGKHDDTTVILAQVKRHDWKERLEQAKKEAAEKAQEEAAKSQESEIMEEKNRVEL